MAGKGVGDQIYSIDRNTDDMLRHFERINARAQAQHVKYLHTQMRACMRTHAYRQSSLWKLPGVNGDLTHLTRMDAQPQKFIQELAMPLEFSLWQSAFFLHVIPWTIVLSRTPSRCVLAANEPHNVP